MTGLTCRGVSKWFGSAQVLHRVDFSAKPGEIHVLVGENGAGKSTLMKIAAGLERPDAGSVEINGEPASFTHVTDAQAKGVFLIHQEPRLFPDLTVLENIWVDEPSRGLFTKRLKLKDVEAQTKAYLEELGCRASIRARIADLSVADQQLVDVASALRRDLRVLIVDEPTSSLTPAEVGTLFSVLRRLRDWGVAIVFIGHRLEEMLEIGDQITVLRDGQVVKTLAAAGVEEDELIKLMVGRNIEQTGQRGLRAESPVALRVTSLSSPGVFEEMSFDVRQGEILGIGGLVGAGRTEILESVFGIRHRSRGSVEVNGRSINSTQKAVEAGVALVPEDRGRNGLALPCTIQQNIAAPNLRVLSSAGLRSENKERSLAQKMMDSLRIKASGPGVQVGQLSGGNQQKVSLAKWLAGDLKVLLVDEPTRGVDVGSKAEIHTLLRTLADDGLAIVMVSSDMRELLSMSDRIMIVREGRKSGELDGATATEEQVIRLATRIAAVV